MLDKDFYEMLNAPPPRKPWYRDWMGWLTFVLGLVVGTVIMLWVLPW